MLVLWQRYWLTARRDQAALILFPQGQPVGPINLILVKQVGQPFGQLEALALVGIIGQKLAQRLEAGALK